MNPSEVSFSIITPSYNRARFLPDAIKSVLSQTHGNWEYIIVDDGSTDDTAEVVKQHSDPRIRYVFQENKERSAARNKGISLATGEYLCFLDSDDQFLPNHLGTFAKKIASEPGFKGLLYTGALIRRGNESREYPLRITPGDHPARTAFFSFLLMNGICAHRDVFKEDRFNESMNVAEDVNLWIRILLKHPFRYIPEYTHVQIEHKDQSITGFLHSPRLERVETYHRNIGELFRRGLENHVSKEEWKEFRKKRYRLFALTNIWTRQFAEAGKFVRELRKLSGPSFYFSRDFYRIMREYLVYRFLKPGSSNA